MEYDFYKILEVPRNASKQYIRKAYYRKAKLYHPDVNNNPKANEFFSIVNQAYETLSDPRKKEKYDEGLRVVYHAGRKYARAQRAEARRKSRAAGEWKEAPIEVTRYKLIMYNLLFIFGIMVGFTLLWISFGLGFFGKGFEKVVIFFSIPGIVLIRDGWLGITLKGELVILKAFRSMKKRKASKSDKDLKV